MTGPVLRDIHVPPAAWWPLAPGWWLLIGLLVLLAAIVAWWLWRRSRRRVVRAALREVDRMEAAFARDGDSSELLADASRLLRRVALRIDPAAAACGGETWRAFLRGRTQDARVAATLDRLIDAPFRARPDIDPPALLHALRQWCKHAPLTAPAKRRRWPPIFRALRPFPAKLGGRRGAARPG